MALSDTGSIPNEAMNKVEGIIRTPTTCVPLNYHTLRCPLRDYSVTFTFFNSYVRTPLESAHAADICVVVDYSNLLHNMQ